MLIGLTGTFGSGKSMVATLFEELGACSIDADALARRAVEPGTPALKEIQACFGDSFLLPSGGLDRKKMALLVFADREKRKRLEAIIHPRVEEMMREQIESIRAGQPPGKKEPPILLNIPLLFEARLDRMVDETVVVTISESQRFRRVRQRDGISERQIIERLASQWPQRRKAARADHLIDNSGTMENTRAQVRALCARWQ